MYKASIILIVLAVKTSLVSCQIIKPPRVGDRITSLEFRDIINYKTSSAKLEDFEGKAIILDFWATWCNPCITGFFKNDSLQKEFGNSLQIIPVTYQDRETANKLFTTLRKLKNLDPPLSVVGDTMLFKMLKQRFLPQYIWIGADRRVKAITGIEELKAENIRKFIAGLDLNLLGKPEAVEYNHREPLFASGQVDAGDDLLYHSLFSRYRKGLPFSSMSGKGYLCLPNHSITRLFQLILGRFDTNLTGYERVILEGINTLEDSMKIGMFTRQTLPQWKATFPNYVYCYEFYTSDKTITYDSMFVLARQDLDRFFSPRGLYGRIEKRQIPILALVRTSEVDKLTTKNGMPRNKYTRYSIELNNNPLSRIIGGFQDGFINSKHMPIRDKTNFKGKIDLFIECDLRDIDAVNKELAKYDLKFIEQEDEVEVIVITKTSSTLN